MTKSGDYTPPEVWKWDADNGGRFASINRPIAGATHDKDLPVGTHSFQLYSLATPNGVKVTIMFEELRDWCKQELAGYKVPGKFVFAPIPKTSTGKVQKFVLREQVLKLED